MDSGNHKLACKFHPLRSHSSSVAIAFFTLRRSSDVTDNYVCMSQMGGLISPFPVARPCATFGHVQQARKRTPRLRYRESLRYNLCHGTTLDRRVSFHCQSSGSGTEVVLSEGGIDEIAATFVQHVCNRLDSPSITVSLGTGEIVSSFLERIASSEFKSRRERVKFVPTSMAVSSECGLLGLAVSPLARDTAIDIHIDQADEVHVDRDRVYYIVGRGENGPQVGQPDIPCVHAAVGGAKELIIFTEDNIFDMRLSGMLPVVIEGGLEDEWEECAEEGAFE